jgi:hypothetical protein
MSLTCDSTSTAQSPCHCELAGVPWRRPNVIMADRFLTISEAEKFTGKSRSTLRRFIDGIVKAENHADRHLLMPTAEEVETLRNDSQPFAWKISEQLLRRQFLTTDESTTAAAEQGSGGVMGSDSSRLVSVLEKSISMLERELAEKNNQIGAMSERLSESNILMKNLQQLLALPAPKSEEPAAGVDQEATPPVKTRRIPFGWLFGQ